MQLSQNNTFAPRKRSELITREAGHNKDPANVGESGTLGRVSERSRVGGELKATCRPRVAAFAEPGVSDRDIASFCDSQLSCMTQRVGFPEIPELAHTSEAWRVIAAKK